MNLICSECGKKMTPARLAVQPTRCANCALSMRNGTAKQYSLDRINGRDLARLAKIARQDIEDFFSRNPSMEKIHGKRFLCSALCQGAAIHRVLPTYGYGIKDLDVWSFFSWTNRGNPLGMFRRRSTTVPFGSPKFGGDKNVDLLWRSIAGSANDPVAAVQDWLGGTSNSGGALGRKAVVVLDPIQYRGQPIRLFGKPMLGR
jgi:hypothetical protein